MIQARFVRPLQAAAGIAGAMALVGGATDCMFVFDLDNTYIERSDGSGGTGGTTATTSCTPGAVTPCYTGPEGTEGIGVCRSGVMMCSDTADSYGECVGDVKPGVENCSSIANDNCGLPDNCPGEPLWTKGFGGPGDQSGRSLAIDPDGNVILAGCYQQTIDFGGGPLVSQGDFDRFLVKLDPLGGHLWSKTFPGNAAGCPIEHLTTDSGGNIYYTVVLDKEIDFGGGVVVPSGGKDGAVIKMAPDGSPIWAEKVTGKDDQGIGNVAVDSEGNVVVVGGFQNTIDFGGGVRTSAGQGDMFVVKFDSLGSYVWDRVYGVEDDEYFGWVHITKEGDVIVFGTVHSDVDIGTGTLETSSSVKKTVGALARYRGTDGMPQWSITVGLPGGGAPKGMVGDADDNVFVTGRLWSDTSFGGSTLTPGCSNNFSPYVAKYDSNGIHKVSRAWDCMTDFLGLDTDPGGSLVVGTANLLADPLGNLGGGALSGAVVAKLSPDLEHSWSLGFAAGGAPLTWAVAANSTGEVYALGEFKSSFDLGSGNVPGSGGYDVFLVKFEP